MYVAKVNFDAGKGLSFNKGENVPCADETIIETLLAEGLIEKVEPVNESPAQSSNEAKNDAPAVVSQPPVAEAPKKKGKKG